MEQIATYTESINRFDLVKKGKQILRVTVFGFPARYKNSQKIATPDKEPSKNNVIIVK